MEVVSSMVDDGKRLDGNGLARVWDAVQASISLGGNAKVTEVSVTLSAANWVLNSTTNCYEYTITNAAITANHLVNIYMDITNQAKMTGNAYTQSYAGGVKIITDELPESDISATLTYQLTEGVSY